MKADSLGAIEISEAVNNSPQPQDMKTNNLSVVEIIKSGDNSTTAMQQEVKETTHSLQSANTPRG